MDYDFCSKCGNILIYSGEGTMVCNTCSQTVRMGTKGGETFCVIGENSSDINEFHRLFDKNNPLDDKRKEGATVKEKCTKCGNDEMLFTTVQLRSADEGQTVFYTCPKCSSRHSTNT